MRGGKTVVIEPHKHAGVFIARGKEDALVTKNLVPGESVYGEKRMSVEVNLPGSRFMASTWFPHNLDPHTNTVVIFWL